MPTGIPGSGSQVTEKLCRPCGEVKSISEFYVKRRDRDGNILTYTHPCKKCVSEKCKESYRRNRKARSKRSLDWYNENQNRVLLRKYGISLSEYGKMYVEQKTNCLICGCHFPDRGPQRLVVDHDHETGKVRGLLCKACNRGIGMLKDDPVIVHNAYIYLFERVS